MHTPQRTSSCQDTARSTAAHTLPVLPHVHRPPLSVVALRPDLRVTAVIDPDQAGARARMADCDQDASFYKDIATLVKSGNVDALAIGTRCNLHSRYAALSLSLSRAPLKLISK